MKVKESSRKWLLSNIKIIGEIIFSEREAVFYDSIKEMPIYNWNEYRDTNNGKFLVKEYKTKNSIKKWFLCIKYGISYLRTPEKYESNLYEEAWNELYQQYKESFGMDEEFLQFIKLLEQRFKLLVKYLSPPPKKRDHFLRGMIDALTHEIEAIQEKKKKELNEGKGKKITFGQNKVFVQKWAGVPIDVHTCSVEDYHYIILGIELQNKRINK